MTADVDFDVVASRGEPIDIGDSDQPERPAILHDQPGQLLRGYAVLNDWIDLPLRFEEGYQFTSFVLFGCLV